MNITRAFAETTKGQIHYRIAGRGETVLMLHQTPRSSDEFLDVIPIFARSFKVIAMDTIGYGDSYRPEKIPSVQDFARAAIDLLESLGIDKTHVLGHHTGSIIAIEIACSFPERVRKLVLSAVPYMDEEKRKQIASRPPIDNVDVKEDGSHLTELWGQRLKFYPKGRPDILTRFMIDVLKVGDSAEAGHHAVQIYPVPERLPLIKAPTLVMCGTADPFVYPDLKKVSTAIQGSEVVELQGGMVPIVEQMPEEFAKHALDFLTRRD